MSELKPWMNLHSSASQKKNQPESTTDVLEAKVSDMLKLSDLVIADDKRNWVSAVMTEPAGRRLQQIKWRLYVYQRLNVSFTSVHLCVLQFYHPSQQHQDLTVEIWIYTCLLHDEDLSTQGQIPLCLHHLSPWRFGAGHNNLIIAASTPALDHVLCCYHCCVQTELGLGSWSCLLTTGLCPPLMKNRSDCCRVHGETRIRQKLVRCL